jgi:predicted metalloprotease with PDZ domain
MAIVFCAQVFAQNQYRYQLNLNTVENDRLTVKLTAPLVKKDSILFHLPKIVPGTYAIHNYGAFVHNLTAFDKAGNPLPVMRKDKNSWLIGDAKKLSSLSYEVDDTWQTPEIKEDVFEPAGTNIAKDSMFALNTFGFFGYFDGLTELPFEVAIQRPANMYGATSLARSVKSNTSTDVFTAGNYHFLADAPILYAAPDTASLQIGEAKVLIAVYSPNKKLDAGFVAKQLAPVLEAQKSYLGGKMPVDNYAFLIYLSDNPRLTRYGALEHSYSSFYYLPEFMSREELASSIKDVASHEFFHIVTPLNIHSEEIGYFDYIRPKMSRHLWLYEGLTEYAAHHAQVCAGLIDMQVYLNRMLEKVTVSRSRYNDTLPFTQLSLGALDTYKNEYANVYQKGALIGLCLDIQLRSLSNGKYGTQQLMQDLSKQYGKSKSFKDETLFATIGKLTYPGIERFLQQYVAGNQPLPLDSILNLAGLVYKQKDTVLKPQLAFSVGFTRVGNGDSLAVGNISNASALAKRIGLQRGDKLIRFNDADFNIKTYSSLFQAYSTTAKSGDTVSWTVLRKNNEGNWEEKRLETLIQDEPAIEDSLKPNPKATEKQVQLRKRWLNQKG